MGDVEPILTSLAIGDAQPVIDAGGVFVYARKIGGMISISISSLTLLTFIVCVTE